MYRRGVRLKQRVFLAKSSRNIIMQTSGFLIFILICTASLFYSRSTLDERLQGCYNTICINLIIILEIWVILFCCKKIDILEPIVLVTGIHMMLFEIAPLFCLCTGDILWFGVDTWDGCEKGTWISTLGYICLCISYFTCRKKMMQKEKTEGGDETPKKVMLNLFIWGCAFLCNTILMFNSGKNFLYILTMGRNAIVQGGSGKHQIGFFGILSYMMLPALYYVIEYSRNMFLKLILFYLTFASLFVRGFRFILLALMIGPLILFWLRRDIRPRIHKIVFLLILLFVMFGFVEAVRSNVRAGEGYISSGQQLLSIQNAANALIGNFSIFKTYYGVIKNIPKNLFYTMGIQIFVYSIVLLIPRIIWKEKPQPILGKINTVAVTEYANSAGTAYPYIGEYYHEFGITGVFFFSFILGIMLSLLKECMSSENIHLRVIYATVYPLVLQVMIRGYTPTNFWMIIIILFPIMINKYVKCR